MAGLAWLHVVRFRTFHDSVLEPGPLCALVGEANAGKSNLLAAIRALLDPEAAPLRPEDATVGTEGPVRIEGRLTDGTELSVDEPDAPRPPVLFLPASLRSGPVVAPWSGGADRATEMLCAPLPDTGGDGSTTQAARGLVAGLEACREASIEGHVFLIEEPELFLPPQTGRYLYRLLRDLAAHGNQVVYSTHSPAFLNPGHLEELVIAERTAEHGTSLVHPGPLDPEESFRAFSEFDAERSELFLARAVILVEGRTEKLILPYVFQALGRDADRERISIVECGGKARLPLFARICRDTGVPFIVLHDRDASEGKDPIPSEQQLNDLLAEVAGPDRTVVLVPDFESVADLTGQRDKVTRAWKRFREIEPDEVPGPLVRLVERAVELASG
ncbi:MAG: TOPRIM nucleotidyl transferase/hydrolase domain-containing protein [Acidimicrobiia bacterium]